MTAGPGAALAEVERLEGDPRLAGYQYLPAVKADLLRRLGRDREAAEAYRQAFALTANEAERAFLHALRQHPLHNFPRRRARQIGNDANLPRNLPLRQSPLAAEFSQHFGPGGLAVLGDDECEH